VRTFDLALSTWISRRESCGGGEQCEAFTEAIAGTGAACALARTAGDPPRAIRKELWVPTRFVDFEHALNFCIRECARRWAIMRRDRATWRRCPRRGYRFIAETTTGTAARPEPRARAARRGGRSLYPLRTGAAIVQAGREGRAGAGAAGIRARAGTESGYAMAHSGLGATHALPQSEPAASRRPGRSTVAPGARLGTGFGLAEPYPGCATYSCARTVWRAP